MPIDDKVRELPADVYDALELVAEVYGGVGGGRLGLSESPVCVHGFAQFLDGMFGEVRRALFRVDLCGTENDWAVRAINERRRTEFWGERVPWDDYVRELNIVRGDS